MLTLYKARTVYEAADKLLSEIGKGEGRRIVIAPDPFTLAVEQSVAHKLGKQGIFDVEVMSFARLASVALGGKIKKCLSPAGSVMLMEKVVRAERDKLRCYRRVSGKAGFAAEMYAAITSIRNSGVGADRLADAAEKLQGYVADKTHDIALLYKAYLAELSLRHTDGTTRLEALVAELERSEEWGDVSFYVVDHVDLNAKQLEVLSVLTEKAKSLSVAVAEGTGAENRRIYPDLAGKLRRLAKRRGVAVKEISLPSSLTGEKAALAEELFAYSFAPTHADSLFLAEAKDRTEEITYLATEITRLVRKQGLRYADIAVITPSFEEYLPYMERIFRRYGIPLFADERLPLSESDVFRHILSATEIVTRAFDGGVVRRYLNHPLFEAEGVEEKDKADFCDYVDMTGVKYSAFKEPFLLYPSDPLFESAEKVRAALCAEIAVLTDLPASAPVKRYTEALRSYLLANDFDQRIASYAERVREAGLLKQAEIIRQTPAAFVELLDTLEDLRGEEEITLKDFLLALTSGAGQVKIAALPVSLDCVYFAPVKQAMYAPIAALFVLGAEEGLFPLEKLSEGIIGEREYAAWQGNGIEIKIENVGVEELAASKFHALQLLLRGERLYLSHSEGYPASSCMRQLRELFYAKEGEPFPIRKCGDLLKEYDPEILFPTRAVAENALVEYSRKSREGLLTEREERFAHAIAEALGKSFPVLCHPDSPTAISPEIFFRDGTVSVSRLESYFKCPFLHFVRYGLRAQEKRTADYDRRDLGNIAHRCMERFVRDWVMKRKKGAIGDEEAREIAGSIAEEIAAEPRYLAIAKQEGERVVKRQVKLCREVAVVVKNQIYATAFRPTMVEQFFGAKRSTGRGDFAEGYEPRAALSSFDIEGLSLCGKIDRVDVMTERTETGERRYAAAYDYKTGRSEIGAGDLYFGKKIQLPLYLSVLSASGYTPVAALYASLSDGAKSKKYLHGPKLADPALIRALDESVSETPSPYTGIYRDKNDLLKEAYGEGGDSLISEEELQAQIDYALAVAEGAVREWKEGYLCPTPAKEGQYAECRYCSIRTVCRHAEEDVRVLAPNRIKAADLLAMMRKEERQ